MKLTDLQIVSLIGQGGFGEILLGKAKKDIDDYIKNKELVVIKVISKEKTESVRNEVEIMRKLKNKAFVSQILSCVQDRKDVFIIMNLYENGSLANVIRSNNVIPLNIAQTIIVDVLLGLQHLHKLDYIHGDMKPGNILMDRNFRAYVADFGLARNFKSNPIRGIWGTPAYQSIEQYFNVFKLDERIDIFNVGVILLEMLTGQHPFGDDNDIARNVMLLNYNIPSTLQSESAISFIRKTICDASSRLNVSNVMEHRFIKPLIDNAVGSFVWSDPIICNEDIETCYTKFSFVKDITGIDLLTDIQVQFIIIDKNYDDRDIVKSSFN